MNDRYDFIDQLNKELSIVKGYNNDDIFSAFSKYVVDKELLRKWIECGGLRYEYVRFSQIFSGTIFEDGIELIVEMFNDAFREDGEECVRVLNAHAQDIVNGLASHMQNAWGQRGRTKSLWSRSQRIRISNTLLDYLDIRIPRRLTQARWCCSANGSQQIC